MSNTPSKLLYIIDGSGFIFRSYFGLSRSYMTGPDGEPVHAVYGFIRLLLRLIKDKQPKILIEEDWKQEFELD